MDFRLIFQMFVYFIFFIMLKIAYDKLWDPDAKIDKEIELEKSKLKRIR